MSHTDTLAEILAARQAMIAAADQSYRYGGEAYDKARNALFATIDAALTAAPVKPTDADPRYRVILAALTEQTPAATTPPQWWSTRWGRRA